MHTHESVGSRPIMQLSRAPTSFIETICRYLCSTGTTLQMQESARLGPIALGNRGGERIGNRGGNWQTGVVFDPKILAARIAFEKHVAAVRRDYEI
jgi:hypothetical protein